VTPDVAALAEGVRSGDRRALARAITLVESRRPEDEEAASSLLDRLAPHTGGAHRIGVTGPPGVGKSTFVDAFGMLLVGEGRRVAVLAVDPSSAVSGGSLLGDKTRMPNLAASERAFIRPSPNAASTGGVARRTRESLLLCEAAGHDVVLVETVGVGQAEIEVHDMVDVFLLLAQPGAGDELQGMKRGILEMADVVAVTKADGDHLPRARKTAAEYGAALRLAAAEGRHPDVVLVSARAGTGLAELWDALRARRAEAASTGSLAARRREQGVAWMWRRVDEGLRHRFRAHAGVQATLAETERAVREGRLPPDRAAMDLLAAYGGRAPSAP
jgi:LAO/AO transport system kinase